MVWLADYDAFGRATVQGLHSDSGGPIAFHLRFAGQYEDLETGWHYNWHRFYDPETGRYLTPDPIGLMGGTNAFAYAGGDPLGAVDPWGLYSISLNGVTTFHTGLPDLPIFKISALPGWQDYSSGDLLYHEYNQRVVVNGLQGNELGRLGTYLMDNPTPNSGAFPATYDGTYNPATPDRGPFSGFFADQAAPDDVVSFLRSGLSGRTYVVNVTTNNHSLRYGIVVRGVRCENGTAIFDNYGEGSALAQALGPISNYYINDIWYWAVETALEDVTGRRYAVNGRDWNENN